MTKILHDATADEAARSRAASKLRDDPITLPPNGRPRSAGIVAPVSPAGEKRCAGPWARLLAGADRR